MEQIKQTAVEWLADKIKWNWQDIEFGEISMTTLVEQAKAMEKNNYICSKCKCSLDGKHMQQMQDMEREDEIFALLNPDE